MNLANRSQELDFFIQMVRGSVSQRILLVEAPSGYGKTDLLTKFSKSCPNSWQIVSLDLKDATAGVIYFISRLQQKLGRNHFHEYEKVVRNFLTGDIEVASNRIVGNENTFQVILQNLDEQQRNLRLSHLQNAFFHDLAEFSHPILLLLDTFNGAPEELRNWLGGRFLAELSELNNLFVVIAGQQIPQPTIEWRELHHCYHLDVIREVNAWCSYAEREGFQLHEKSILAAVKLMKGRPDDIVKALQLLEREDCD